MIDIVIMFAIFMEGLLLGFFFFGGLLWTVRRGLTAKHPGLWFFASWLVRIGVVVAGFSLLFNGRWEWLVVCAAGFLIARMIVIRFTRTEENTGGSAREVGGAS